MVPDVPAGTYGARVEAQHYILFATTLASPQSAPLLRGAALRRVPSLRRRGHGLPRSGLRASGALNTAFDGPTDVVDPLVTDRVPLNASSEYAVRAGEATTTGATIQAFHATGSVTVVVAPVVLNRSNLVPLITVP